jgi:predicted RecB family endonuclease
MSRHAAATAEAADEWEEEGARHGLSQHLRSIKDQRDAVDEQRAQWRRLQAIKQAEIDARAKLDAIRARDEKELADQLANPTGLHVTVDHDTMVEAELEFARATREAAVARACEAEVSARSTAAVRKLEALERQTTVLTAKVLAEEASAIATEIAADSARLRVKHARLVGLEDFIAETESIRHFHALVPAPVHPDAIFPAPDEVRREAEAWRRFALRVTADPTANFEQE